MKPFLINKLQPNLSSLLVHKFKMQNNKLLKYKVCNDDLCSICSLADKCEFLILENGFYFPFFEERTCSSQNLIYFNIST